MVCLGNICRSPIAEGVLRHKARKAALDWIVDSAGTESYHIGEPPHHFSQKICRANGIDISDQSARRFAASDFEKYDIIYAMGEDVYKEIRRIGGGKAVMSKVLFFLNESMPGSNASVPDPWYGEESGYAEVYKLIDKTCNTIIEKYSKENTSKRL
jgi:protein-tyrosine phosphatase